MTLLEPARPRRPTPQPFRQLPVLVAAGCFGGVAVVELVAVGTDRSGTALVCRLLAMPLLVAVVIAGRGSGGRTVRSTVAALLFCWLGDTVGGADPLLKIAFFLAAHLCYIGGFWPYLRSSMVVRRWVLGYLLLLVVMGVVLGGRAGGLAVPVAVYGCAIVLMAALAGGLGRGALIGGLLFAVSDGLLGILWFYRPDAGRLLDLAVMLTYLCAQALLVRAVVLYADRPAPGRSVTLTRRRRPPVRRRRRPRAAR